LESRAEFGLLRGEEIRPFKTQKPIKFGVIDENATGHVPGKTSWPT